MARECGFNVLEIGAAGFCRTVSSFLIVILCGNFAGGGGGGGVVPLVRNTVALKVFGELDVFLHCWNAAAAAAAAAV